MPASKAAHQIESREKLIDALKDFAVFGQEAREGAFVKELLKQASIPVTQQAAFRLLVRLGVWREDENLLLHEHGISAEFPEEAMEQARELAKFSPPRPRQTAARTLRTSMFSPSTAPRPATMTTR